jgi:hypothetical protein
MDLAAAIAIVASRPFVPTVTHRAVGRVTATRALPFVGQEPRTASPRVVGDEGVAGPRVRVVAPPQARLARRAREHTDDWRAIIGRGAIGHERTSCTVAIHEPRRSIAWP